MKTLLRFAAACALFAAIAACGQKGDLVRPSPAAAVPAPAR
ncbi:LPS translocon maturation chaperone LptM [Chiayiivirga flava]|uniref:Putative small lipoprotein YifL n=1 Tax=Chiayiivirga flava TaxID=659595 RepID=A0A7W8D662_9GAMM|nr:lipoprotein [Chiayiivirga flava]MBB5207422.1 putative small lipoprotein YifL [Chiayiivirga flava]